MAAGEYVCTDNETELLEAASHGKTDDVVRLLAEKDVNVDCRDVSGMTPLQHAVYKGYRETCEILLAHGADVNSNYHDQGYTALMFAAISGNSSTTQLMLEHGAKTSFLNKVGRSASQMAAFVSQHHCVSLINNFFSKEQLDYYTVPHGFETEPKLPPVLAPTLHKYILVNNLNPVGLSLFLRDNKVLLKNPKPIVKVLDIILAKSYKEASDTSDFFSLKIHYYLSVFKQCEKSLTEKNDNLESWIKNLLRGRDGDGFQEFQEKFIRDVIKHYPYPKSTILQHMVRQVAPVKIGDSPTALHVLDNSINGPHFADDDAKMCHTCGNRVTKAKCSACKVACYCNQTCQKMHWFTHKKMCKEMGEEFRFNQERQRMIDEDEYRLQDHGDDETQPENDENSNKDKPTCPLNPFNTNKPTAKVCPVSHGKSNPSVIKPNANVDDTDLSELCSSLGVETVSTVGAGVENGTEQKLQTEVEASAASEQNGSSTCNESLA